MFFKESKEPKQNIKYYLCFLQLQYKSRSYALQYVRRWHASVSNYSSASTNAVCYDKILKMLQLVQMQYTTI